MRGRDREQVELRLDHRPRRVPRGGTLEVQVPGTYVASFSDSFAIVQAGAVSGRFDAITGPPLEGNWQWRVRYEPTRAVLGISCAADFNIDIVVDTRDVLAFLNAWSAGNQEADIDRNGRVDTRDVLAFLNLWAAGC